jgi:hypothetical protein
MNKKPNHKTIISQRPNISFNMALEIGVFDWRHAWRIKVKGLMQSVKPFTPAVIP